MNKVELIAAVAAKTNMTKTDAEKAVNAVMESVKETLVAGDKVQLVGFGTFEVGKRAERNCRNPKNGETMVVPATKAPKFKAGKALKDAVNA